MIEKMTKYSFILLSGEKENFLEGLQNLGVVDITRSNKPIDESSEKMLAFSESCKRALAILKNRKRNQFKSVKLQIPVEDVITEIFDLQKKIDSLNNEIALSEKELEIIKPWGSFNVSDFKKIESIGYSIHFFKTSKKSFSKDWADRYPLKVISDNGSSIYFVIVSKDNEHDFPISEIPAPKTDFKSQEEEIKRLKQDLDNYESKLDELVQYIPDIENRYCQSISELDLYIAGVAGEESAENHLCIFEGFAPESEDKNLTAAFDNMPILYIKEKANVPDNPPIKLKNNRFNRIFEVLTDMYGRPAYNGFDPTPYIAIFFMLFFAFCMGDAGYGIILTALGFGLRKVKSAEKLSPIVIILGIATILVGFIFHTFFSMDIMTWKCIPYWMKYIMLPSKIAGYDGTMLLAIILGIIHICIAVIVKTIYATKQNGFVNSLSVWGWTLLIVGGVIVGGIYTIGVLNDVQTKWIIIILGSISAIGIFFLNNLHRNPLINIGAGLWETYNTATGLLGDVLSYLRLYALGLAGSMLGFAFNDLGKIVLGDGHFGFNWIFFLLIVLIGHILNMAMAALGAFVHPLRLNFLEFFKNSGYEAEGRNYKPLVKPDNK